MPLVSIIIPVYNAEIYISDTISSVLAQTHQDWEMIIVDDGSTDNSLTKIKQYSQNDSRIKIILKTNSGVSDSRNAGILISKGDFIAFLDADDVWLDANLEKKIEYLKSNNAHVVYSDCEVIDENSNAKNRLFETKEKPTLDDILLLEGNYITAPSGTIFKKEVFNTIGLFDEKLSNNADQDIWIRLLTNNFEIALLNNKLWKYRVHSNNMSSNIQLLEKDSLYMFNKARENNIFKSFVFQKKCFSRLYLMLAGSWWKNDGNKIRGLFFLIKSLLSYPPIIFKILKNNIFEK